MAASFRHEGLIALIRDEPRFAAELLREILHVPVPPFTRARRDDAALPELVPVPYAADAVILLGDDPPALGVVFEAQLARETRKRFTWPLYAAAARARHECPFVVVVVAPAPEIARWAAEPIELGGGNVFRAQVIDAAGIPVVTDVAQAVQSPQLVVLSAMAHGRGDPEVAASIARAATIAIEPLPPDQRLLYSALIESSLSEAARKVFAMIPEAYQFFSESQRRSFAEGEAKGKAEGEAKGKAEGKAEGEAEGEVRARAELTLRLLAKRGVLVTAPVREKILACTDLATLDRWFDRALTAADAVDLFR
jgi:hypothetical protein